MYIGLHVKHPLFLSDLNETSIFSSDFRKTFATKFHENRSVRDKPFHADGRADKTKLIISFRNFAKASNKALLDRLSDHK
jgi:hypothetical protein